jgi:hypothetical protein
VVAALREQDQQRLVRECWLVAAGWRVHARERAQVEGEFGCGEK